jgi:hypothetical protein
MIDDETAYFIYDQRMDIDHYTIPKLTNQLIQPIFQQKPYSYKSFQVGVLRHVYSESFGFIFDDTDEEYPILFKANRGDTNTILINDEKVFPLFKKGDKIRETKLNQVFYLNMDELPYLKRQELRR